jgi:hypothetical protein
MPAWLDVHNPLFQSAILPLAAGIVLIGVLRFAGGAARGPALAVVGAALALLLAYWAIFGLPPFPPRASSHKMPYLIGAGTLLAAAAALFRLAGLRAAGLVLAWLAVGVAWLAESKFKAGNVLPALVVLAAALFAGVGFVRSAGSAAESAALVLVASLGLAGIAFLSASVSIAQGAGALAAASGAYLLWNWPKPRFAFGAAGVLGLAVPAILIAAQMGLYTRAEPVSLALIVLTPFAAVPLARLKLGSEGLRTTLRPLFAGVLGAIPVAAALAITYAVKGPPGGL